MPVRKCKKGKRNFSVAPKPRLLKIFLEKNVQSINGIVWGMDKQEIIHELEIQLRNSDYTQVSDCFKEFQALVDVKHFSHRLLKIDAVKHFSHRLQAHQKNLTTGYIK